MKIREQKVAENWSDVKQLLNEANTGRIITWVLFLMGFTFGIAVYIVFLLMSLPKRLFNGISDRGKRSFAYIRSRMRR